MSKRKNTIISVLKLNIVIKKDKDLYIAHCLDYDIVDQGDTEKEAMKNMLSLLSFYYEYCYDKKIEVNNLAPKKYWKEVYEFLENKGGCNK